MGQILKPWTNGFGSDMDHLILPDALFRLFNKHWKVFFLIILVVAAFASELTVHPLANLRWSLTFFSIGIALKSSFCKPAPSQFPAVR